MNYIESYETFSRVLKYRVVQKETMYQHGGRPYDDLQNWLDMTSLENPL